MHCTCDDRLCDWCSWRMLKRRKAIAGRLMIAKRRAYRFD